MANINPNNLSGTLKEAADLLAYMKVDEGKLQEIFNGLTEKIKNNPILLDLVHGLSNKGQNETQNVDFQKVFSLLMEEGNKPLIEKLFAELGNNSEIIENVEKKILPILFSK